MWVDRLRAVAQLHEKAIAHTHPPPLTLSPPPPPPGSKSQLTVHGEPTEALQNLSLSVLEAFGSVHDILHQADLRHSELRAAVEQLPMQGPKPNCLDDDLLTIKATSQAALISMQEALGMLQEIVEGTNANQQVWPITQSLKLFSVFLTAAQRQVLLRCGFRRGRGRLLLVAL